MAENDEVLDRAAGWLADGKGVALATVVGTWGSSPRPPGSMLAVEAGGTFVGSVSGGCIEGAVVREGLEVMQDGAPRLLDFGVTDEQAWAVGLACGGEMKVFVEAAPDPAVIADLMQRRPVALVSDLETGESVRVHKDGVEGSLALDAEALDTVRQAIRADRSTPLDSQGRRLFARVFNPPARMIVVGAVHVAQSLAPMAALAGFEVVIVDPRRAFATEARFPGVTLNGDWPDDALAALAPDSRTAVITLTHDPKLDDPALEAALASDAFYIGALGSRKTHAKRVDRLHEKGFDDEAITRIHAPVGLDLGGRKAAEIAVSVLAQVIAARYGKDTGR